MSFSGQKNLIRWFIIIASFVVISLILWNTYTFFQNFKAEERKKMEIFSSAQTEFVNGDTNPIILKVLNSNSSTPIIGIDKNGEVGIYANIDEEQVLDSLYVDKLIARFKKENTPIEVYFNDEVYQTLYYGDSPLLNRLKYYPLALLLIIFLFAAVVYFFYRSSKNAEQNRLWSGMAKETAHQIGTPLSSLIGWTEILKSENVNKEYISEIEKDINRLQTITDRFSKIGSIPTLKLADLVVETQHTFEYLKTRSSKLIEFEFKAPEETLNVNLNSQLYSWTIENLVKNAIDAMKGRGKLSIELVPNSKDVDILISDTGKGIPKGLHKTIFEPGYTTRKRGWGLGLSLAKRIIEDYHNGKIKVLSSEIDKGTTFQITLKRL